MPGLFGGLGCSPALYDILETEFRHVWPGIEVWHGDGARIGGHAFPPGLALYTSAAGQKIAIDGESSLYRLAASCAADRPSRLFTSTFRGVELSPECKGNLAILEPKQRRLHLGVEWTGSFPLYFAQVGDGLLFSSHLRPLARTLNSRKDDLGILEFLLDGYTFLGRTPFDGIRRLQPGQVLQFTLGGHIKVEERSGAWAEVGAPPDPVDTVWRSLTTGIQTSIPAEGKSGLMMSAGWDSRTLLGIARATRYPRQLICYSHGDTESRELRLVKRICRSEDVTCRLESIDNRVYDLDRLQRGFERVENVVFPHWHRAGELLAATGVTCAFAGVYGEVLGGHYGPAMLLGGHKKIMAVVTALLRKDTGYRYPNPAECQRARTLLRRRSLARQWCLNPDYENSISNRLERLNADIDGAVDRLEARGITNADQLIEAFVSEHRGAHYINAQILSCRGSLDVALPFADRHVLTMASQLPLARKIHNRLNQEMLRRYAPTLLRYPFAATLLPAGTHILAQEASRFVRRAGEGSRWKLHFRSGGRIGPPRLGWVNFEFLRDGRVLRSVLEDLKSDIWDRAAFDRQITAIERGEWQRQLHPMYDMVSKIYTIDLFLRSRATDALTPQDQMLEHSEI